jgi:methylphosphotriester-DNA--protein-cysteine methyltransferase
MLNSDDCYAILGRRDPGADGRFFVAVKTTGIYCRPICPARVPLRRNILFYRHAAEAQSAGFRPCLRCRPESAPDSPAWVGSLASINRALALIEDGALVEENVEQLAAKLGMTARHLRRLFIKHIGIGPVMVEQTRRVHLAKKLAHETSMSMTDIAFASGFGSLRRFNETFQRIFDRPPSALRRAPNRNVAPDRISLTLAFRPPIDWEAKQMEARAMGAVVTGPQIHHALDFDGIEVTYRLLPKSDVTLSLVFEKVPLALLGKSIAKIKRLHLSSFQDFSAD